MIQEYKNKELKSGDAKIIKLKCVVSCWAPGLGEFKEGEIISGTDLVLKLQDNPNFVKQEA